MGKTPLMVEIKDSPGRQARRHLAQLPPVVAGLGALAGVGAGWLGIATGLAVFAVALLASLGVSIAIMHSYRCPDCHERLDPPAGWWHRPPGRALHLRCNRCGIDWRFGLRGHED